jgi:ADP-ribosyl-[dinitrogen reductase] hydrolase
MRALELGHRGRRGVGAAFTAADIADGLPFIPEARRGYRQDQIGGTLKAHPSRFNANGSAVAAFKAALSAVAHSTTYEGTAQAAIAIGHDTDTVAAIAGALAGAKYGASAVPAARRQIVHGWPDERG